MPRFWIYRNGAATGAKVKFKSAKRFSMRSFATTAMCLMTLQSAVGNSHTNCNADAMLVFDASGSMATVGQTRLSVPRIVEAREAIRRALPDITPFRRIGLMVYGPGPRGNCANIDMRFAPTRDAASRILAEVDTTEPQGGTPLTEAVRDAAGLLTKSGAPGVVVLLTDGTETCGGQTCEVAESLGETDVTVHVIGFRLPYSTLAYSDHTVMTEQSEKRERARERSRTATRCLADMTGGLFVTADSTDELVAALQEVLACPLG